MIRRLVFASLFAAHLAHADDRAFVAGTALVTTFDDPFMQTTRRSWQAGVSGGYALDRERHLVARAELAYLASSTVGYDAQIGPGYSVGGGLAYYAQRAYRGPFAEAGVAYLSMPPSDPIFFDGGSPSAWSARLAVGYQLTLASGLSIAGSAGIGWTWVDWWTDGHGYSPSQDPYGCSIGQACSYGTDSLSYTAQLRVGYAF